MRKSLHHLLHHHQKLNFMVYEYRYAVVLWAAQFRSFWILSKNLSDESKFLETNQAVIFFHLSDLSYLLGSIKKLRLIYGDT